MDKKLYLIDLDCYARADEKQKKKVKESHCFDFGLLPTKGLQKNSVPLLRNEADNVHWQR
ncbi:MAG: hypothetical protein ACLTIG_10915 [Roseburia hominis]